MIEEIRHMVKMQDEMNSIVNSDWRNQGWNWNRAIYMECTELIGHYGWKWWKAHKPNMEQIHLELVDIFHFILSYLVERHGVNETVDIVNGAYERHVGQAQRSKYDPEDTRLYYSEKMIFDCIKNKPTFITFVRMCHDFDLTFPRLFALYCSKNVLNKFRQEHGYKTGHYIKDWSTKPMDVMEDNEYLMSLHVDWSNLEALNSLNGLLENRYSEVVKFNHEEYGTTPHIEARHEA